MNLLVSACLVNFVGYDGPVLVLSCFIKSQSIIASLFSCYSIRKKTLLCLVGLWWIWTFHSKLISYLPYKSKVKRSPVLFVFILYIFKLQFGHYHKLDSKDWDLSPLIDSEPRLEDTGPVKHHRSDSLVKYAVISWTEEHQLCMIYGSGIAA